MQLIIEACTVRYFCAHYYTQRGILRALEAGLSN